MNVYTCVDHDFHWPVGVASVIVAENEASARRLLDEALAERGLKPYEQKPYTLELLDIAKEHAVVLRDGDY